MPDLKNFLKTRLELLIGSLAFLIPLTIYLLTLYPTVSNEDSGELITAAWSLGIAHPPGYPLFAFIGKIFTIIIPFGEIAWRVNVMSAIFSALTGWMVYLLILKITKKPAIGLFCTLILAFSDIFFSQAIRTEVYALNSFFLMMIIYLAYLWHLRPSTTRLLYLIGFLIGLGLTNHQILLLIAPAVFFFVILKNYRLVFNPKVWIFGIISTMIGLSFYLYMPIRSAANPALDWGNTETAENFWQHVTRGVYFEPTTLSEGFESFESRVQNSSSPKTQLSRGERLKIWFEPYMNYFRMIPLFTKNIFRELLGIFTLIGLFGIFISVSKKWREKHPFSTFLPLCLFFLTIPFGLLLDIRDPFTNRPFYLPAIIVTVLGMGYAWLFLSEKIAPHWQKIIASGLLIVGIIPLALNFNANNQSNNFLAYDLARATLYYAPENSILYISGGDSEVLPLFYLQKVESLRPDIKVFDNIGNVFDSYENWPGWEKVHAKYPDKRIFTQLATEPPRNFVYRQHTPYALEMIPADKFSEEESKKIKLSVLSIFDQVPARGLSGTKLDTLNKEIAAYFLIEEGSAWLGINNEKAIIAFERAKSYDPTSFYLLYFIAHTLYCQDYFAPAASYLEQAINYNSEESLLLYLEYIYARAGNKEMAAQTRERLNSLYYGKTPK